MSEYKLHYLGKTAKSVVSQGFDSLSAISGYIFDMNEPAVFLFSFKDRGGTHLIPLESTYSERSDEITLCKGKRAFKDAFELSKALQSDCYQCQNRGKYFSFPDMLAVYGTGDSEDANVTRHLRVDSDVRLMDRGCSMVVYQDNVVIHDGYDYYSEDGHVKNDDIVFALTK